MQYHWAPVRMQEVQALETFESHREPLQEKLHSSKSGTTFIAAGDAAGGAGGDVSVQAGRSGGASAESGGHVMLLGRDASGLDVAGGAVEVGSGTSVA